MKCDLHETAIKENSLKIAILESKEIELKDEIHIIHSTLQKIYYAMLAALGSLVILLLGVIIDILWR